MHGFLLMFRIVPFFSLSLFLAGCGMWKSAPPTPSAPPPTPVAAYMMEHAKGDSTTLDDPQFGENILITMQDSFISASGEECRRATLVARQREAEVVVICRKDGEGWRLAPRIWGQGI